MKDKKVIVFDLDDTLIKEKDYLKSAYREIAGLVDKNDESLYTKMLDLFEKEENVFAYLETNYKTTIKELLPIYRNHFPKISLVPGAENILDSCIKRNYTIGLITDGRSITQRNKIKAVGVENYFDKIIISEEFGSEKPSEKNFMVFDEFEGGKYYIADNTRKDFITPNKLGWTTICVLDDGENIHSQDFELSKEYLPEYAINKIEEVKGLISSEKN